MKSTGTTRSLIGSVCTAISLTLAPSGWGDIVADFQADYLTPTPSSGWSYLWNGPAGSDGPIGTPANYDALIYNGGVYSTDGTAVPTAAPGNFLFIGGAGSLQPGNAEGQDGNLYERYVIAAFTLGSGGQTAITNLTLTTDASVFDGVNLLVHVNSEAPLYTASNPAGGTIGPIWIDLGLRTAGDTIYVAVGSGGSGQNDFADSGNLGFQIDVVPEPTVAALVLGGSLILCLRSRTK